MREGKSGGALFGIPVAIILFVLSFMVGSGIAGEPGNVDTGMVAVLMTPVYAATSVGIVLVAFFSLRRHPEWFVLRGTQSRSAPAWLTVATLSLTAGVTAFLLLYYPVDSFADWGANGNWYFIAVAVAPLLIVAAAFVAVAVYRTSADAMGAGLFKGEAQFGWTGMAAALLLYYPMFAVCVAIALAISRANDSYTNVDAFMAVMLMWPLVTGPGFAFGLAGGRLALSVNQRKDIRYRSGKHLAAMAAAMLGGALSVLLVVIPLTVAIIEEWQRYGAISR